MSTPAAGAKTASSPSSLLAEGLQTWDHFWFSPADPTTICFIRVCTAVIAFYVILTYSWGLLTYIGPNAWIDSKLASDVLSYDIYAPDGGWDEQSQLLGKRQFAWSVYYHATSTGWIIAIHSFFLVCTLVYALGLWCRYTGFLTWLAAMSYAQRAWSTVFGLDTMLLILLAYLLIAPTGAVFSLDRWLAVRRARRLGLPDPETKPSISANFAIRLIQVHLCLIYFAGGTSKLLGPSWWNGTAVSQVLLNPLFAPLESPAYYYSLKFLSSQRWLWEVFMTLSTLFTLVFELSFLFLVWDMRWRWLLVTAAVLMHIGIGLLMGLTTFSIIMLVMVASFFPPESIRLLLAQTAEALSMVGRRRETSPRQPAGELVMTR